MQSFTFSKYAAYGNRTVTLRIYLLPLLILTSVSVTAIADDRSVVQHVKSTAEDAFDSTGLWILGAGTAATLVSLKFDNDIHDAWKGHQRMSADVTKYGDFWGTGIPEGVLFLSQIYFDKENGIPALEGFLMGGVVTHASKYAIARARPESETRTSMPSGHTQAAFSIAASTTESYGWRVGLPFWCLGVFTGLTRLADNAHWLSDVVAGATVGTLFGRAGYKHHRQIQPIVLFNDGHVSGVALGFKMEWP